MWIAGPTDNAPSKQLVDLPKRDRIPYPELDKAPHLVASIGLGYYDSVLSIREEMLVISFAAVVWKMPCLLGEEISDAVLMTVDHRPISLYHRLRPQCRRTLLGPKL